MTSKLHFLGALPRVDGDPDASTTGDGVDDLVARSIAAWKGPRGPKLRLLPEIITLDDLRVQAEHTGGRGRQLLLGINEKELAPVGFDMDCRPARAHLRRQPVGQEHDPARH
ncbi:MAG: hypothetical protein V9G04_00190 [Nocardioides sp.]